MRTYIILSSPTAAATACSPSSSSACSGAVAAIEESGHRIRFAVSRGPLNIASYLLGHNELLIGVKIQPQEIHKLLSLVTDFIVDWLVYQAETFDTIGGIFILDDLIGFLGDKDFQEFVLPYFKKIFACLNVPVRMLHNDAAGLITARYLAEIGVNVFNFSFKHGLDEIRRLAGESVVLLGNIPPRDVMAQGTPDDVRQSVIAALASIDDKRRLILSCGGGMPPDASTANVQAFIDTIQNSKSSSMTDSTSRTGSMSAVRKVHGSWFYQLNRYQWFVLTVCTLGWVFDTMGQQLFNVVRNPAVAALIGIGRPMPKTWINTPALPRR